MRERLCYTENTDERNTHKMGNITIRVKCVRVEWDIFTYDLKKICEYDITNQQNVKAQQRRKIMLEEKKNEYFILLHLEEINL